MFNCFDICNNLGHLFSVQKKYQLLKKEVPQTGNPTNKKPTTLNDQDKFMERLLQGTPMLDGIVSDDTDSIILIVKTAHVSAEEARQCKAELVGEVSPIVQNYEQCRYLYFAKIK